jgi:hypothetical protein
MDAILPEGFMRAKDVSPARASLNCVGEPDGTRSSRFGAVVALMRVPRVDTMWDSKVSDGATRIPGLRLFYVADNIVGSEVKDGTGKVIFSAGTLKEN